MVTETYPPEVNGVARTIGRIAEGLLQRGHSIPVASDFHTNFHAYSRHYGFAWLARPVAAYLRAFHNRAACTMVPTREMADDLGALRFERLRVVGRGVDPH